MPPETIANEDYDEFDESQLDATEEVAQALAPSPEDTAEPKQGEDASEEEGDEAPAEEPGKYIPRHRYNFQRDQRVAAERQLQETRQRLQQYEQYISQMQQQTQAPQINYDEKISELDQKIEGARADGDSAAVARFRAEQRQLERESLIGQLQAQQPQGQQSIDPQALIRQSTDSIKLENLVTSLEQQYPMLDETSDKFDPDLSDEVMSLYDTLRSQMSLTEAMDRAVRYVTKANDISPLKGPSKPARKNIERNLRAAAAQPPELDGVGLDSGKAGVTRPVDVASMTQEDFEKLSDVEIEKLLSSA